jgi:hypothetical protein
MQRAGIRLGEEVGRVELADNVLEGFATGFLDRRSKSTAS